MNEPVAIALPTTIVLFERDPELVSILQTALAGPDITIIPVASAVSLIKELRQSTPDVLVAAFESQELGGLDVLRKTRELGYSMPLVLYGPQEDGPILRSFRGGAADYWPKPFLVQDIKERLIAVLAAKASPVICPSAVDSPEVRDLMEGLTREKKQLNGLLKITSSLNVSGDTKISLNHLTDLAAEIMHCEAASIMLVNRAENVLEFVVASGEKKHKLETIKIPMGEGIAGWVAVNGQPQIVNDTRADKRFTGNVDAESGFVTRKILAAPMNLDGEVIGVVEVINTVDNREFTDDDLRILMDMSDRVGTVIAATRKIEDQQNFFVQTTNILVRAIEKKDMFAEGHSWKVAEYSHKIAAVMDSADFDKNNLHFGALLHDIGKLTLPSYIFNKREISDKERELIRQHPVQGAKMLEPITLWRWVVPYVLYHHEAWDGSGYPFGIAGTAIPLGARILNLTEAFSVMRSPNSYKKQMTLKETILEIMRMSGKQFDPDVVKALITVLEKENWPR